MTDPATPSQSPASHDLRIAAHIIDSVIIAALLLFALFAGFVIANALSGLAGTSSAVLVLLPPFLMHPWYYVWMARKSGATPGKRFVGLAVVRRSGEAMDLRTMSIRYLGLVLSTLTLGFGHLAALVRRDRRAFHDHVADTVVVHSSALSPRARLAWVAGSITAGILVLLVVVVAVHLFRQVMEVSVEAATKGNIGAIRSAISIYYGDHDGEWPASLATDPSSPFSRYMESLPAVKATHAGIGAGRKESPAGSGVLYTTDENITVKGKGWRYNPLTGHVFVNSCATDSRGVPYSCYGY